MFSGPQAPQFLGLITPGLIVCRRDIVMLKHLNPLVPAKGNLNTAAYKYIYNCAFNSLGKNHIWVGWSDVHVLPFSVCI